MDFIYFKVVNCRAIIINIVEVEEVLILKMSLVVCKPAVGYPLKGFDF